MKNYLVLLFGLHTLFTFGQFPEGFETTVPPVGWTTFTGVNGLGTAQSWQASNISNSGAQSAYCRYENVSGGLAQDWLVTPQFTPTPSTNTLTFMQRQSYTTNYGSVYKVFISTGSQTNHADFTLVDTQLETDFTYFYTEKEIDLGVYLGVPIYVAFVLEQDDGDNWLIDDVALTASASCTAPDNLSAFNFGLDFATVAWTENGIAPQWQIEYGLSGFIPGFGYTATSLDTSFNITGLAPYTAYDFYVSAVCFPGDTSVVSGPFSFSTLSTPLIPDYLNDFSNFPGQYWSEGTGPVLTGPSGNTSNWQSDLYLNTTGNISAKINIYFSNSNDWLISPDFDLSGGDYVLDLMAAVTEWNVTTASNMGSDDQVDLLISTDFGINWSSLYQWNASNTPSNTGTALPTIDLAAYNGIVRFAILASDGTVNDAEDYDFYIDDFSITGIPAPPNLVMTEIMYNSPEAGTDTLEFIELYNNSTSLVDLTGFSFSQGVTHTFTGGSIAPGAYFAIAYSADSYQSAFGVAPDAEWTSGGLSNGGEDIILIDTYGQEIDVVNYDDSGVWPSGSSAGMPDGGGSSIVLCDAISENNDGANWSSSTNATGTTVNGFELLASPGAQNGNSTTDIINACDSYTWIDGVTYTANNSSATQVLTNTAGCDSTVTLNLTLTNSSAGTDIVSACDSYTWIDGVTYTANNNSATQVLTNTSGCDSTVTLNLTLTNSSAGTDVISACDSYTWIDGVTYTASNNSATQVLSNAAGCDSTVTLNLTLTNSSAGTDVISACDSYTWIDGVTYTANNNSATQVLTNTAGCDSTVTLDLTLTISNTGTDVISACDSYTWIDGVTYTADNNSATQVLTNTTGCDSTVTLDLTLTNSSAGTDVISACDSYTWIDGVTYTADNNSATQVLTNTAGCDSTVTLDLTLTNSSAGTDVISACDSYTWIDGITYTASNNAATQVLTNTSGCDSTVTLNLTIINSSAGTDVISACDSYTWIDGVTYTASNNSATQVLSNAAGCDSTVTLDLTLTNSTTGTDIITACDSYTWIDGLTYTASNNNATFLLNTASGCDSLVTLDLTIANSLTGTDLVNACDSYTWIDGVTYTESNFSATQVLTAVGGCDSTVTLNLTISNSSTGTDVINACDPYTWIDGVEYTASNNTATFIVPNTSGCDSTVTLNLTINIVNTTVTIVDDNTLEAEEENAIYQWLNCDDDYSVISSETSSVFTTQTPGDYAVEITINGCADTSMCYAITGPLEIQDLHAGFDVSIFPNPTLNSITFNIEGIDQLDVELFDLQGKRLMHQNGIWDQDQMSLESLVPGSYIIRIHSEHGSREMRVVKQ
jgi:PDZ domain-containing secreted protein